MQIKDYITKNFPSLNWNILPQIFAENGVEMNEEIEAYLRNTPENTNWSILEQLGGSGDSNGKILVETLISFYSPGEDSDDYYPTRINTQALSEEMSSNIYTVQTNDILKITIDDIEWYTYTVGAIENSLELTILREQGYPSSRPITINSDNNSLTLYGCGHTGGIFNPINAQIGATLKIIKVN